MNMLRAAALSVVLAAALSVLLAPAAFGTVNTFTSRATFNAAAPPLVTEDFEEFNIPPTAFIGITGPLDTTTSFFSFVAPGDILPRLSLADVLPGPDANDMIIAAPGGIVPTSSKLVGTNREPDDDRLQIAIAGGVTSVGFDLFSVPQGGLLAAEDVSVELFNASDVSLGVFVVPTSATGAVFFGAISDADPIARVTVYSPPPATTPPASHAEFVDNISFDVPEPSSIAIILFGIGVAVRGRRAAR
jgi:hypothetical protein